MEGGAHRVPSVPHLGDRRPGTDVLLSFILHPGYHNERIKCRETCQLRSEEFDALQNCRREAHDPPEVYTLVKIRRFVK